MPEHTASSSIGQIHELRFRFAMDPAYARKGPFTADNAHQALMLILNPPESLFGEPSLLTSEQYVQIRVQAEAEVNQLLAMKSIPVAVPVLPKVGTSVWDSDFKLAWEIPTDNPLQGTPNKSTVDARPRSHYMSRTKQALLECLDTESPQRAADLRNQIERRYGIECEVQTVRFYMSQFKKLGLVDTVKQGYILRK